LNLEEEGEEGVEEDIIQLVCLKKRKKIVTKFNINILFELIFCIRKE
jgi:hypothetical protein